MSKLGFKVELINPKVTAEIERIFTAHGLSAADNESILQRIAGVATRAMRNMEGDYKDAVRTNIRQAGFGSRWSNAWRVTTYPEGNKISLSPAVYGYHKIPYSEIFEQGGTIAGKNGLLWIPFDTVPKIGRTRATAKQLSNRGVKMFSINRAGRAPILAAKMVGQGPFGGSKAITVSKLKQASQKKNKGKELSTVPLFHGHSSVQIRKRFNIRAISLNYAAKVSEYYAKEAAREAANNG